MVCVVRMPVTRASAMLVRLPGGARVAPYHPVSIDGQWLSVRKHGYLGVRSFTSFFPDSESFRVLVDS